MASEMVLESRDKLFRDLILSRPNEPIPVGEFLGKTNDEPGGGLNNVRQVQRHIKKRLQDSTLLPGATFRFFSRREAGSDKKVSYVSCVIPHSYRVRDRRQERETTKDRIGDVLWNVLLDIPMDNSVQWRQEGHWELLNQRRQDLMGISALTLLMDSGSTTEAAVKSLVKAPLPDFWGMEEEDGLGGERHSTMFPELQVVTNSFGIASLLYETPHGRKLRGWFVGGEIDAEYESCSGQLTEDCLSHFEFMNTITIIGASGYRQDPTPSFLCNSLSESYVKRRFLKMATIPLRVVILDSQKLNRRTVQRAFTSLKSVDLVVVDDGRGMGLESNLPQVVNGFGQRAKELGVAVAVFKNEVS